MSDKKPAQEDIIEAPGMYSRMISADYILEHGRAPIADDSPGGIGSLFYGDYTVDWSSKDAYTNAVDVSTQQTIENLQDRPIIQNLFAKVQWDEIDRAVWERELANELGDVLKTGEHKNLAVYRNDWLDDGVDRSSKLNDLSKDITNNTSTLENDCDTMAITQAVIMQKVESAMLPEVTLENQDNHKVQGNYYIAYGRVANIQVSSNEKSQMREEAKGNPDLKALTEENIRALDTMANDLDRDIGKKRYHAVIVSDKTGNVIDSTDIHTNGGLSSIIARNADTIEDFKVGKPILLSSRKGAMFSASDTKINLTELSKVKLRDDGYENAIYQRENELSTPSENNPSVDPISLIAPLSEAYSGPLTIIVDNAPVSGEPNFDWHNDQHFSLSDFSNEIFQPLTENARSVDPFIDPKEATHMVEASGQKTETAMNEDNYKPQQQETYKI